MRTFIAILVSILAACSCLRAQVAEIPATLQELYEKYAGSDEFSADLTIRYFDRPEGGEVLSETSGIICRNGSNYYERFSSIECIATGGHVVLLDHEDRVLGVRQVSGTDAKPEVELDAVISDVAKNCSEFTAISDGGGLSGYALSLPSGEYARVDIWFQPDDMLVRKLVMYQRMILPVEDGGSGNRPRIELTYANVRTRVPLDERFRLSTYCRIRNGIVRPAEKYADYIVLD